VSVTAPRGFRASGVAAGLRAGDRLDLGLLVSDAPATAAGLFTRNAFAAAPVEICRRRLLDGTARAVVANSGQANAGTGPAGLDDAEAITSGVARALGLAPTDVLPASTGVIGPRIRVDAVLAGVVEFHTDRPCAVDDDPGRGGLGEHAEVFAAHRRLEIGVGATPPRAPALRDDGFAKALRFRGIRLRGGKSARPHRCQPGRGQVSRAALR